MIKHLLYNFRIVINNHSVLKALKEAICSILLLVILLPSVTYAEKDCCVMQNDKKRCCTYNQQFCYAYVQSKCIQEEELRYQNPDILQKKVQLLESSAKQAWSNAQNHQFSSNLEKFNALTNAGTQTREIISLSEQLKKALVNEGKARGAAFRKSSKLGKGKTNRKRNKDFQLIKDFQQLTEERQAALKLAQEFGNKASGQYKIIKTSARDLVLVAGMNFWNALLLYKKIDEELDSKVRNGADKKSILIAKKKVLYEIEKVLKVFVEGRDMYNTFVAWVIGYSDVTEEKENKAIEFLLQNLSYSTVRRSASFETTLKAVIEIYKNGDFINELKLQNESVKTDIAEIERSIQVAEDEMRRKQEEEEAKKLLEFQNKVQKVKEEVDAAKDKFKEKQTQAQEAYDQANASGDLEDKIEALNKKKKEYEAAKKYKEALDKAIDIGNNNPDLVRERDSLGII
ncbi:type IV secretion system domain protein [Orientia tsutsugamushi str. UT76]|nr:type IV secretion system domain protein [Orientia tsutsugamushi str. UT76]